MTEAIHHGSHMPQGRGDGLSLTAWLLLPRDVTGVDIEH